MHNIVLDDIVCKYLLVLTSMQMTHSDYNAATHFLSVSSHLIGGNQKLLTNTNIYVRNWVSDCKLLQIGHNLQPKTVTVLVF